jgi:hypothetical protein
MSPARRLTVEELDRRSRARREAQRRLREQQRACGLIPLARPSESNRKSEFQTVEEERAAREDATLEHARVIRTQLPRVLDQLSEIPDPRQPKKVRHKLALVVLYGILMFVYQMSSRREANRTMTRPMFLENLRSIFPELDELPHQDTLHRLLCEIEVDRLETVLCELVRDLIRKKKLRRYRVEGCYVIAIDGTQKIRRNELPDVHWQERQIQTADGSRPQYYVYVLEANLVLRGGVSIPLMSELLEYVDGDVDETKQDCELKAFYRLAERLNGLFPRLPVMLVLDGLYPSGPVFELCRRNGWQFMIVLPDRCLPSVWEEVHGLEKLLEKNERLRRTWGDRTQYFRWFNEIPYQYGPHSRKEQILHVVICEERWQEVPPGGEQPEEMRSRHVWISSEPLNQKNVVNRCNRAARQRWAIESCLLVEKRHGYQYEHCFARDWNAMRGYHYLMRLAHALSVLAQRSTALRMTAAGRLGPTALIEFVRQTLVGPWLDRVRVRAALSRPGQLRLA